MQDYKLVTSKDGQVLHACVHADTQRCLSALSMKVTLMYMQANLFDLSASQNFTSSNLIHYKMCAAMYVDIIDSNNCSATIKCDRICESKRA